MKYSKVEDKFIGKVFTSNNYGDFVVIEYTHFADVKIQFVNTGAITTTTTAQIRKGCLRDPSVKKVGSKNTKKKCKYVGNTYSSKNYGYFIVESVVDTDKVLIKFLNTSKSQVVSKAQINGGSIRDYSAKQVKKSKSDNFIHGVGYKGEDEKLIENNIKIYQAWCAMIQRCYSQTNEVMKETYKGCTVSDNFKYFPYFVEWWGLNKISDDRDYQLDKDILVKGNRLYSEDTCALVPKEINLLCIKRNKARGELPIGVTYCKNSGKYKAQFSKYNRVVNLGLYHTPERAFLAYKEAKEDYIKAVAESYKHVIDERVYNILMEYEVSIDD